MYEHIVGRNNGVEVVCSKFSFVLLIYIFRCKMCLSCGRKLTVDIHSQNPKNIRIVIKTEIMKCYSFYFSRTILGIVEKIVSTGKLQGVETPRQQ